jgi:hypothetical protein
MSIYDLNQVGFRDSSAIDEPFSESKTVAMVNIGQRQLRKIEAPSDGRLTLHLAMIAYLNFSSYKNFSVATRNNISFLIVKFFTYLESYKSDEFVPLDLLCDYKQSLKKNDIRTINGNGIYSTIISLKSIIDWGASEKSTLSESAKLLCRQYYLHAPKNQKPDVTPTPPLSQLFSGCPYSDTQLLDSLKKLFIWIINYEGYLRMEALQIEEIRLLVESIRNRSIYECPISFGSFDFFNPTKHEARELYAVVISSIRASNNLVLKERLVSDIQHPFDEGALTEKQLNFVLDSSLMKPKEGAVAKCGIGYQISKNGKRNVYKVGVIKSLSLRSLLVPSDVEIFAMQCLLASEKVNLSSIEKMELDDVVNIPQGIQFQLQKRRRPKPYQVNITALHPQGSTLGKTYNRYIEAKKASQKHFNDMDNGKILGYQIETTKHGFIGYSSFGEASNKYFQLILTENSHLRNELLKAFDENVKDLDPFFWIFSRVMENNRGNYNQNKAYNRAYKNNGTKKRSDFVLKKSIGLSTDNIRQSSIISENIELFSDINAFDDINVTAQLSNHSPPVHNEVYIDSSTAKEKIESDRLFASRIGTLMAEAANKMGDLIKRTSVFDYNEALEVFGLPRTDESASERLTKKIDELGIDVDLMDSFQAHGKKTFLANKTTTALIIKYLEHIRANFDDLLNDDTPQLTKATLAARDYFYFSNILEKFPSEIRKDGEKYANLLSFDYAKLSDIVGVANYEK